MRIEESSDGMIRIVELDPTKRYWFIVRADSDATVRRLKLAKWEVNGQIISIPPNEEIEIIENVEGLKVQCAS